MTPTDVAVVQVCASTNVEQNVAKALDLTHRAAERGAQCVFLPEAFSFIGPAEERAKIVECLPDGGPILDACRRAALADGIHLFLGGFNEAGVADDGRSFNTTVHLDPSGKVATTYRKIHLFNVDLPDGTRLHESVGTAPGDRLVTTDLPFGRLGLTICYDMRFPPMYQDLVDQGAIAIAVPSAFTKTTGAAHWHTLLRARAIETQCYVIAAAQHGRHHGGRESFGHSVIIDPWGEIVAEREDGDGFAIATIDPARVATVRNQLPSLKNRRPYSA